MTQHSRKTGVSGEERIRALLELNRTINLGGKAIITLQDSLFTSNEEFNRFASAIEKHFGFARAAGLTGLATAYNATEGKNYSGWIITLEKIANVEEEALDYKSLWQELRFPRVARRVPEFRSGPKQAAQNKIGAYQDNFSIGGGLDLSFNPFTMRQAQLVAEQKKAEVEQQRLGDRIKVLLERYPKIKDIPAELLLSITPDQVNQANQDERDEFYKLQIQKFGSEERIPTDIIQDKNSYILVRKHKKTKDGEKMYYLCLAKIAKDGKTWGSYGTKYFYPKTATRALMDKKID
jgi:hypothetical protein